MKAEELINRNRHDGDRHKYNMSDDVNDWLDNDQWGDMELGIHE